MSRRLPPLNALRAFEATARLGSVSLAAAELHVTHSAVSHQIKNLELTLGLQLFERKSQRLRLTSAGTRLLLPISSAFTEIATVTTQLTRPTTSGVLSVSCIPGVLSLWMLPRLKDFIEHFPDVQLQLISSNDPRNLQDPDIDLCILYGNGNWADCWVRLWSNLTFFPIASPGLLNSRPLRSVRDLKDHVLLHSDDGREWKTWLSAADASDAPRRGEHFFGDASLSTEAARHGQGIALGDEITVQHLISRGELVVPFNLTVAANDAFYLACRSEVRTTPIVQAFVDWLFASLEADPPPVPQSSARHILRRRMDRSAHSQIEE